MDEDLLWNMGLSGTSNPEVLLNTVVFFIGKGFALRAFKVHYCLRSPLFASQFVFMQDDKGSTFIWYKEDVGIKTNKGGLKHRQVEPKEVDVYAVKNSDSCPVSTILLYLSKLPKERKYKSFYLQPCQDFTLITV